MTNRPGIPLLALVLLTAPLAARGAPATVKVFEAEAHAAPDPASPVIHTFTEGARVSVSENVVNGFRKVRLPDGKVGYVEESAVSLAPRRPQPPRTQAPPAYTPPPPPSYAPPPPPPPEYAPPPPRFYPARRYYDPTAYRHVGMFTRFDLGLGYMGAKVPSSATAFDFDSAHGVAGELGIAIGGAVRENVLVGGHFWANSVASPTLSFRGATVATGGDFSATLFGIGPSFDFYFMPQNVYLTVTPSLTWVRFSDFFGDFNSDAGFGTRFALGKEWWVTGHWGLGLAGWYAFSFNPEGDGGGSWRTFAGGLAFSATFN